MTRLRIIIADDEPPARGAISALLGEEPDIDIIAQVGDGAAALSAIRSERPDLVFLDVQMPGLNGFEVLDALKPKERPTIIFVTAFDEHAIRAFELAAVDYLVKPFTDERFKTALDRARRWLQRVDMREARFRLRRLLDNALGDTVSSRQEGGRPTRLRFKVGGDYCLINAQDIVWIEAQDNVVKLAARGQVHQVRSTLLEVEKRLAGIGLFARVHRSFLVNTDEIERISNGASGELVLVMSDSTKVPVSRSRRSVLMAFAN